MDCSPPRSFVNGDSPVECTGVGCLAFLQVIFPTQGSNPGLPHCRRILYHLSHQGSPWILELVVYPFSKGSSWPRNQTGVSWIAGRFFLHQLSYQGSSTLYIYIYIYIHRYMCVCIYIYIYRCTYMIVVTARLP